MSALLILPVVGVLAALGMRRPLIIRNLAPRYDWTPAVLASAPPYRPDRPATGVPDGVEAGQELALRTHILEGPQPSQPERSVLLFFPRRLFNVRQQGITENNLTADTASVKPVRLYPAMRFRNPCNASLPSVTRSRNSCQRRNSPPGATAVHFVM